MHFFKNINCNYVQRFGLILFWYLKYSYVLNPKLRGGISISLKPGIILRYERCV
jgi:hypothetical protein